MRLHADARLRGLGMIIIAGVLENELATIVEKEHLRR
jgi:hypothetical protein